VNAFNFQVFVELTHEPGVDIHNIK
jgi:hypothetical protein